MLLLSQGLIRGGNCPVPGRERRFALPGTARPRRSLLGCRLSACAVLQNRSHKGIARAQRRSGAVPGSVQSGADNSCEVWGIFTSSPAPAPTQKSQPSFISVIKLGGCFGYREGLQNSHCVGSKNNKQISGTSFIIIFFNWGKKKPSVFF